MEKTNEKGHAYQRSATWPFGQVIAAHDSSAYQTALKALGSTAKRDVRVIEGIG